MATYEFRCTVCEYEFEIEIPMNEYSGEADCPSCEQPATRHHRTAPNLDTYYPGSFNDQHPVPGI